VSGPARCEQRDGVTTITLDDPERRNALSTAMLNALGDHLAEASTDPSCRAVILANTGPSFCAGADLKGSEAGEPLRHSLADVLTAIVEHPKPVIGRIGGHCMGGGVGLAAACDISLASSEARFGFTEVRIGVAPAIISVVCLPKLRRADALELFLTGERIEAQRAAEVGLVNRAVPPERLDEAVAFVLSAVMRAAPGALAAAKRLVYDVPGMRRDTAFTWTAELSASLFASPEAAEGMAAFRERRPPSWAPGQA
jgi:methylglutaconyl-CoA hydratase